MSLIRNQRCLLASIRFQRIMFPKKQLAFNLIYDRPVERNPIPRHVIRFYSSDVNQTTGESSSSAKTTTSFSTASPFGKASSDMHGGNPSENTTSGSSENQDEKQTDEPLEIVILKKAMNYVPELGFTDEAISRGEILFQKMLTY